jgi:uncharacterized membrane protein
MKINTLFSYIERYKISLSGIALGLLFFSASLTPSMIPRSTLFQGLLGGLVMAIGYFIIALMIWTWQFLELPELRILYRRALSCLFLLLSVVVLSTSLSAFRGSQNELRELMTMVPLANGHEVSILLIAVVLFGVLLLISRFLLIAICFVRERIPRRIPPRVSLLFSFLLVAIVCWNIGNGVIARNLLNMADETLREIDALIDPDLPIPLDSMRSGSAESLIPWKTLGARGRQFISGGMSRELIGEINPGKSAKTPIRVYAGLNSADSIKERAELILEEMKRVGAFERSLLVVVTPTGTGWIDPAAVDPLEVLHGGDIAIVGMQYSYLMSPLALLVEPDQAPRSAKTLIDMVYEYWRQLPSDSRPKLYLHGLSLGSYGSENAVSPLSMIDDPISGALWSGPTFGNPLWRNLSTDRNPDSPAWLPRIGDGRTVRFTTQTNALYIPGSSWSRTRIIFLQYPSDPITFFEVAAAYRPSEWMVGKRAPDVLPDFKWYPLITMLQLAIDMLICTDVPKGFGHVFAAEHYIDVWVELTDPEAWQAEDIEKLKQLIH